VSINAKGTPAPINIDAQPGTQSIGFQVATHSVSASSFINTDVIATAPSLSLVPIAASANNNVNVVNTLPTLSLSGLNHTIVGLPETQETDVNASAPSLSLAGVNADVDAVNTVVNAPYLPVVPGLFIDGSNQGAGRFGTVYRVNTLADNNNSPTAVGDGTFRSSLRAALEASGARIVIFEVSGIISLNSSSLGRITVSSGNLTVAGQTAPSPGIMVRDGTIQVSANDVLFQHFRCRSGDGAEIASLSDNARGDSDALRMSGSRRRVLFDHMTMAWGVDENGGAWGSVDDIGIANCIIHEGFSGNALHPQSPPRVSNGLIVGASGGTTGPNHYSIVRNLFTHNNDRSPFTQGDNCYIANNYAYNWDRNALVHRGARESDPNKTIDLSIVNNYYRRGTNSDPVDPLRIKFLTNSSRVYVSGNDIEWGTVSDQWDIVSISEATESNVRVETDFVAPNGYTPLSTAATPQYVLDNAGARPLDRDPPEDRNVADAANGTGRISSQLEQTGSPGGYGTVPDGWPTSHYNNGPTVTHTLPANPNDVNPVTGYTNMEDWLHAFSAALEP
jgi:hypothetical protein